MANVKARIARMVNVPAFSASHLAVLGMTVSMGFAQVQTAPFLDASDQVARMEPALAQGA